MNVSGLDESGFKATPRAADGGGDPSKSRATHTLENESQSASSGRPLLRFCLRPSGFGLIILPSFRGTDRRTEVR